MSRSRKKIEYRIQTGDGQMVTVDQGICQLSEKLTDVFKESGQIYLENSSEVSVQSVIDFYIVYIKFTETQKKKWANPISFIEKIGKANQPDSDLKLVEPYKKYEKMVPQEFFDLLKTAWDMRVLPLVTMLSYITATKTVNKTTNEIEKMLALPK
jgi:hypothetical protein